MAIRVRSSVLEAATLVTALMMLVFIPGDIVYTAGRISEYRTKFPGKAVIYSADGYDRFGNAAREAGGSLAP